MECPMDELKNKCDMSINAVSISNKKEKILIVEKTQMKLETMLE